MAGLLYAGFDYGTTANLPGLWDSATAVTLDDTQGRAGGAAAFFDALLSSELSVALTWGDAVAYQGMAFRPVALAALFGAVLAQCVTTAATYRLVAHGNGALTITQDNVTICEAGPALFDELGCFVEWSIDLTGTGPVSIRVNGLTVGTGVLALVTLGESFTTFKLGGGVLSIGQWYLDDVYLLDGVAQTAFSFGSRVIDNASFLGDIHVEALFPTGDFFENTTDAGYTPWDGTPSAPPYFSLINENPPDDGVTNVHSDQVGTPSGGMLDIYASVQVTSPRQGVNGYGLRPGGVVPWELFAVQWIGHLQSSGGNDVAPTIREVVAEPSTDQVDVGASLAIPATVNTYAYEGAIYDRDPLASDDAWTFDAVFLIVGLAPARGTREFGITVIS